MCAYNYVMRVLNKNVDGDNTVAVRVVWIQSGVFFWTGPCLD